MKSLHSYINERLSTNKDEILLTPKIPTSKQELIDVIKDHFNNGNGNLNDIDVSKLDKEDFYSLFSDLRYKIKKNNITEINISDWKLKGLYWDDYLNKGMFERCTTLKTVILPDCLEIICNHAFYDCKDLNNIIIPDRVEEIGNYAFSDCSNLTNVTIPNSVTLIGISVFGHCSKLSSLFIPYSVSSIGVKSFYDCPNLTITTQNEQVKKLVVDSGFGGEIIVK